MTSLFKQIESIIPTLPGWSTVEKTQHMAAIIVALKPEISVEVGVFGGKSFFGFALAHKYIKKGVAWGIDPWSTAAALEGYSGENSMYWKELNLDTIYAGFAKNIEALGVQPWTNILRQKSDDVMPPVGISALHVDGQHTEQAIRDVERFAPNVKQGGIAILDDVSWSNDGDKPVLRAVDKLKQLGFVELYKIDDWAVFQRL